MSEIKTRKKDFIWNTAAGVINAGQSAIILIFISRELGTEAAGIFTIGYALANLFYTIGKYAMRNYQVTDIKEKNSFADYVLLRVFTITIALLMMAVYVFYQHFIGNYNLEKIIVVVLVVLWKMIDAVEDVFYGMYQQHNRLDIGSKCYCIRLLVSTMLYCILTLLRIPLLDVTAIVVIFSTILAILMIEGTWKQFDVSIHGANIQNVKRMFIECLPLCVGMSLSIYVGNLPKYLIDAHMDEITQAYFGYLMMPAFVTLMLSGFVYHPMVRNFGVLWNNSEIKKIWILIGKIILIIISFTAIVVCCGMWIGLDILSWIYGVDLSLFTNEFFILLIGGGVFSILNFLLVPLTSVRAQNKIALGFIVAAIVGLICGKTIVVNYGMLGVTILYLMQNVLLCLYFMGCLGYKLYSRSKMKV